jgi:Autotransporter beta-domain
MPKHLLCLITTFLVATFLSGSVALADQPPPQTHEGLQFRAAIGPAYFSDSEAASDGSFNGTISGVGLTVDLYLGLTPTPGLRIGGFLSGTNVFSPSVSGGEGGALSGVTVTLYQLGPYVDWYPSASAGFHVLGGVALAGLSSNNGQTNADGSSSTTNNGFGIGLDVGVGYDWWVNDTINLGVLARFTYAHTSVTTSATGTDSNPLAFTDSMISPAVLFSVAYH